MVGSKAVYFTLHVSVLRRCCFYTPLVCWVSLRTNVFSPTVRLMTHTRTHTSLWLLQPCDNPTAAVRLLCLHQRRLFDAFKLSATECIEDMSSVARCQQKLPTFTVQIGTDHVVSDLNVLWMLMPASLLVSRECVQVFQYPLTAVHHKAFSSDWCV
jgi:hypothetical protein